VIHGENLRVLIFEEDASAAESLRVHCLRAGGEPFESNMKFNPAELDGDVCSRQLKSIVRLALKHGRKYIAGHVDEAGDLAKPWQYGVDFIRGNFVQKAGRHLSYDLKGEIA